MTKPRNGNPYNGTIFNHPLTPAAGLQFQWNGATPLLRVVGKVSLNCSTCLILFERYACWIKRKKGINFYCCKACSDEGKRRPTKMQCVSCGEVFIGIPSDLGRVVTCSIACCNERKSKLAFAGKTLLGNHRLTRDFGNGNTKLISSQVSMIESSTEQTSKLAKAYGVSGTLIRNLRRLARIKALPA